MLDVGEDVFHGPGDDAGLVVVSGLERGKKVSTTSHLGEKRSGPLPTKVKVFPDAVCP